MKIVQKAIKNIHPYENNPRINDQAVDAVAESIKEFGFANPILLDKDDVIIAGHTRYKAALQLGMEKVPCITLDTLTEEQASALRLADNKIGELADWDFNLLPAELASIGSIDMTLFGFDETAPEDPDDIIEDDFEEPKKDTHNVKRGQVWILGSHKVMCGDAASKKDADILMGGVRADMVFTDPPYGVAIGDKNKTLNAVQLSRRQTENIKGDTLAAGDLHDLLLPAFVNIREHCKDDASYYVSSPQGGEIGLMMMMMMRDAGLEVRHNLIWVKNSATFSIGRLDYDYRHEPIFYTWTRKHKFYGGYSDTVIDDTKPLEKMSKEELKEMVHALRDEKESSVIYCDKPRRNDVHPTMKPVKLVGRFIINSSQKGDAVLDFFGGSGSTLIAAEQLGREAYLMELDPHYVDVIITRWEEFTGEQAVLIHEEKDMEKKNH